MQLHSLHRLRHVKDRQRSSSLYRRIEVLLGLIAHVLLGLVALVLHGLVALVLLGLIALRHDGRDHGWDHRDILRHIQFVQCWGRTDVGVGYRWMEKHEP